MKRVFFFFLLLTALLAACLGVPALAEEDAPVALIAPDQVKLYHNNTYAGDQIIVGRGRQTYLYFTAPEDGFTKVLLNLQNE